MDAHGWYESQIDWDEYVIFNCFARFHPLMALKHFNRCLLLPTIG